MATKSKKNHERKMEGLSLPDVVKHLLKEPGILRWDASEGMYEVLHGERFETRFNELRRVRNKEKTGGSDRPFSRMHNFFSLASGEKWARTGTKFRPLSAKGFPEPSVRDHALAHKARVKLPRVENGPIPPHPPSAMSARWPESKYGSESGNGGGQTASGYRSSARRQAPVVGRSETGSVMYQPAYESDHSVSVLGKRPARFWAHDYDDDYIPAHLIDVVARSLLNKRPRLGLSQGDFAEPVAEYVGQASFGGAVSMPKVLESDTVSGVHFSGYNDLPYGRGPQSLLINDLTDCFAYKPEAGRSSHLSKAAPSRFDGLASCFEHDVIEVSSEGGSCQPSPEVPALSLCDEDLDDLAPLDLGVPAVPSTVHLTHTMTAPPPPPPSAVDLVGGSVLDLDCDGGSFDDAHGSLGYSACQVCGVADGACMGSCEHVARCGLEGGEFLGHLDSPGGGSVWDALHTHDQEDGAAAWW